MRKRESNPSPPKGVKKPAPPPGPPLPRIKLNFTVSKDGTIFKDGIVGSLDEERHALDFGYRITDTEGRAYWLSEALVGKLDLRRKPMAIVCDCPAMIGLTAAFAEDVEVRSICRQSFSDFEIQTELSDGNPYD